MHAQFRLVRLPESQTRRIALLVLSVIGVFCLGLTTARSAASPADTYTGAFEKAPHANLVAREGFEQWAKTEQDRYRLRVAIPDVVSTDEEVPQDAEAEGGQISRPQPRAKGSEDSQTVAYAAILVFGCVLAISRLRPEIREKYFHPWELMPAKWRRRQQQACAPRDPSRAEGRRLAKAMEDGAGPGFLEPAPEQLEVLGRIIASLLGSQDPLERQELLVRGYLLTHALTPLAEPHRERAAWQIRHSLEGLLKKLLDQPLHATATALYTAAKAVEVLKELRSAGAPGEAGFESPIRILAVYDDPITCHVMAGVLQAVFGSVVRATDGESAMAYAGEQAFDVVFMDASLQGIDGYAVCAMLRQIAMHHDTPVVLVTDQADAFAMAEAQACGGNDLISKPLLAVEVTLKALILALRYRLAGGGGTPEKAAKAFETRLLARGSLEQSGVVCGTADTEILRVVRRR